MTPLLVCLHFLHVACQPLDSRWRHNPINGNPCYLSIRLRSWPPAPYILYRSISVPSVAPWILFSFTHYLSPHLQGRNLHTFMYTSYHNLLALGSILVKWSNLEICVWHGNSLVSSDAGLITSLHTVSLTFTIQLKLFLLAVNIVWAEIYFRCFKVLGLRGSRFWIRLPTRITEIEVPLSL